VANSTTNKRLRLVVATPLLLLAFAGAACAGSSGGDKTADKPSSTTASAARGDAVVIETFAFSPKLVRVHVGDTVNWTNHDNILHTVTSGTREYDPSDSGKVTATHKSGAFDMPLDGKGAKASFTFKEAGTFHYFCDRHPGMEADVEVS
jgi:plastocyanin